MTLTRVLVVVAGLALMVWELWYFLAPRPGAGRRGGKAGAGE